MKRPYQEISLGWVTFLSVLALLPIPTYPLQHWWYLDDHIICEFSDESKSSRKDTQRPAYLLRRFTLRNQDKNKVSFQNKSSPEAPLPLPKNLVEGKDSESYSTFSFPCVSPPLDFP